MINKRGLSQIVTTILFVLVGIVAIGIIWIAINAFFIEGTGGISLVPLTLDLGLESAKINYTTGIAALKVVRNAGKGDLRAIKFIIEDPENSEVVETILTDEFPELAKRTFYIDLNPLLLNLAEIYKISIAPVYYSESSGKEIIGKITDTILDLNLGIDDDSGGGGAGGQSCETVDDCPPAAWIGLAKCNADDTGILQNYVTYTCQDNLYCSPTIESDKFKMPCLFGTVCIAGQCVSEPDPCDVPADCGVDGYIGVPGCYKVIPPEIIQDYRTWNCISNICGETVEQRTTETCEIGDICQGGICFESVECTNYLDCWGDSDNFGPGYICELGYCVLEQPTQEGIVNSAWPFNVGEYFDSSDFPYQQEITFTGEYIIFPISSDATPEERCMKIIDYNYFEESIPYVRLNETLTNVSAGDTFQTWETSYACILAGL